MTAVAIVGIAVRLPDADDLGTLWRSLVDGHEAIHRFVAEELRAAGVADTQLSDPAYIPYGTRVHDAERFDAELFGLTPAEAALCDPQQRWVMETALRALEDGGVPAQGRIGVFASSGYADYLIKNVLPAGRYTGSDLPFSVRIGNETDFLASRVCHALDLRGPAIALQSACSSSLVGVDAACTALALDRCDAAVVGAAAVRLPQPAGYTYTTGSVWSADGHTRPFDAAASGFVVGNGAATVVLKRLADAIADRDRIYAVIRGLGITNDGADKVSYSAPSRSGQQAAAEQALVDADVPASAIGYVEAHGCGTPLGDPIEIDALAQAYGAAGGVADGCALGSIKANVGHLIATSGIAGLVKAALVLHHQVIPPQINYAEPNPLLSLEAAGLTIHTTPRRASIEAAAVSSTGIGGTNAHAILTRAPSPALATRADAPTERDYALPLSARTPQDLRELAAALHDHLGTDAVRIDDLAYTLAHGRARGCEAVLLHARTIAQAREQLLRVAQDPTALSDRRAPADASFDDLPAAVKIRLPGHPLHRERHWIDPPAADPAPTVAEPASSGALVDDVVAIFRRQPHDAGVALGAAWALAPPREPAAPLSPYLGRAITRSEIDVALTRHELAAAELSADAVADRLLDGQIGAIVTGRAEVGPRALCHRSILAAPTDVAMRDRLNRAKGRELWRPLSPVGLPDDDGVLWSANPTLHRYMIGASRVSNGARAQIPAVVHVDGTARPQLIERDEPVAAVLAALRGAGAPSVLINTSFNVRGEPIVDDADGAIRSGRAIGLDFLILDDRVVEL